MIKYPETKELLQEVVNFLCDEITKNDWYVLLPGIDHEYDQSGEVEKIKVHKRDFLSENPNTTIEDLYTGERRASHVSGSGWFFDTFFDVAREKADEVYHDKFCKLNDLNLDNDEDYQIFDDMILSSPKIDFDGEIENLKETILVKDLYIDIAMHIFGWTPSPSQSNS